MQPYPLIPKSITFACAVACALASPTLLRGQAPPRHGRLPLDSRAELAAARARGDSTVTLVLATNADSVSAVVRSIVSIGGHVRYRHDPVGYLRADVPTPHVDAIANRTGIDGASIVVHGGGSPVLRSGKAVASMPFPSSTARSTPCASRGQSTDTERSESNLWSWSDAPFVHPYSPVADLGIAALRSDHPSYDGRGVTIAHLESAIDLLAPELEQATTLDGRPSPKVLDVRTAYTAGDSSQLQDRDNPWVMMSGVVNSDTARSVLIEGRRFGLPRQVIFVSVHSTREVPWISWVDSAALQCCGIARRARFGLTPIVMGRLPMSGPSRHMRLGTTSV
jgi:hypothetical protein